MSGWRAKRASTACDCAEEGVLARRVRLIGRWERGSAEVGMDSGMGSDMVQLAPSDRGLGACSNRNRVRTYVDTETPDVDRESLICSKADKSVK